MRHASVITYAVSSLRTVQKLYFIARQGVYMPEYKVSPALHALMDSGIRGEGLVLAASFPLLHNSSTAEPDIPVLPATYNPAAAASQEWPARMASAGLAATVTPGDPHHVKVTVQGVNLQASPSSLPPIPFPPLSHRDDAFLGAQC